MSARQAGPARRILVTGGAGFIGSALARHLIAASPHEICVFDKLTYAGNMASLASVAQHPRFHFVKGDICDAAAVRALLREFRPAAIVNLAAESHVDRSIDGPAAFIETNIMGVYALLEAALQYWRAMPSAEQSAFRLLQVSTDEVFGSLGPDGAFCETTAYAPNSPYSASKAAADHLVRAWAHTYNLPVLTTNCSNNYGPYHFPEKLIPLTILNALEYRPAPVYGRGENSRDWLYVEDHVAALTSVLENGRLGESYNVGGLSERRNLEIVEALCDLLDEMAPSPGRKPRRELIDFVADRPGHDLRYAIDCSKIQRELGWRPRESLASGLRKTVRWYLDNRSWWEALRQRPGHGERLGAGRAG